jgi:hypothetical protein
MTEKANPFKTLLLWYTRLFAVWIVLFAVIGYFWPAPFVFLNTVKMFGPAADNWQIGRASCRERVYVLV